MKLKVNDDVIVIAGKDKGKQGKITKIIRKDNKVVVEGINLVKKHQKPNNKDDHGSIVTIEAPIHVSNVKKLTENKKVEETKTAKKNTTKKAKKD